jgi:transglutaminase-like putative cysteine protease
LDYEFSVPGKNSAIEFVALIPRTMPNRQSILVIDYSEKPSRIFAENGNSYADFMFVKQENRFRLKISVKAELFRYDLATALKGQQARLSNDVAVKDFLNQATYIEKDDSRIQQIAEAITGRDEIDTVKKIYSYVIENLEYGGFGEKQLGAVKDLQRKKGDCSEYSDLFVALCRAKQIPARVVTGYTVRFDNISPKHHWAEVYLQKYGWVPFDPSWGDVQNTTARAIAFETLSPRYIYLSHIRNDKVLHNKHFYFLTYWGGGASLKDSIKFKPLTAPHKIE